MVAGLHVTPDFLATLRHLLAPAVAAAGFVLVDASAWGDDPEVLIGLLEYRADIEGARLLLGFYEDVASATITGELWSPDRLRHAQPTLGADGVAFRRITRRYSRAADPWPLACEISDEVATWLAPLRMLTIGR